MGQGLQGRALLIDVGVCWSSWASPSRRPPSGRRSLLSGPVEAGSLGWARKARRMGAPGACW